MKPTTKPRSKYNATRETIEGVRWDSKAERIRWLALWRLKEAGLITDLRRQVRFPLRVNGELVCNYVADFVYVKLPGREIVVEDVKGFRTPQYILKSKLFRAVYGFGIREV